MIVVGYVIKGKWRYLEHDWVATEGSFVRRARSLSSSCPTTARR